MFRPVFNYILHPEDDQEGIPFVGGGFQACKTITNHSETFLITRSVIFAVLFGPFGGVPHISRYFGFSTVVDLAESFRMHWSRAFSTVNLSRYGHFSVDN